MSNLPESLTGKTVAVLGGTGPQGRGLARRFAAAGVPVVIGSRSAERAEDEL
ncbi:NAD(P)-binding domain-containing protein, partial [Nocardioides hankookensis]